MQHFFTLIFSLIFIHWLHGQRPTYHIVHTETKPSLDGTAEPEIWNNALIINEFTTTLPRFNESPAHPTSVKMVAHPKGIALFFECTSPTVRADGSQRDNMGYADYVAVGFDTWNDDQNAFVFQVSASGQTSERQESSNNTDVLYHSRWEAAVSVRADGWTAELWIPYTALRFPAGGEQQWGVQLWRYDRSTGETSTWSPQNPVIRDEVWQYGDLEDLGLIRQERRKSLTLFQNGSYGQNKFRFPSTTKTKETNISAETGLDIRYGLNSATTLDIFAAPDYVFDWDMEELIFLPASRNNGFIHPGVHESGSLFSKSGTFWEYPIFYNDQIPGITLQPGQSILSSRQQSSVLNRFFLSTRTKNNVGIGINHTLWQRPEFIMVSTLPSFSFQETKVPRNPGDLEVTAEKAMRNNSWVHTSHSVSYFRGTAPSVRSACTAQLRDKSNRYEIAGRFRIQHQNSRAGNPFSKADGFLSLGKVNSKWTWGSKFEVLPQTVNGFLLPFEKTVSYPAQHRTTVHIDLNNYRPRRSRFLQVQHSLNSWSTRVLEYPILYTGYNIAVKDHHFNQWQAGVHSSPYRINEAINFNDLTFYRQLKYPVGGHLEWSSDQRRRWILYGGIDVDGNTRSNARQMLTANLSPVWSISNQFRLEGNLYMSAIKNQASPATIDGIDYSIYLTDWRRQSCSINLHYFPGNRWNITLYGAYSLWQPVNFELIQFTPDGTGVPIPVPDEKSTPSFSKSANFSGEIKWYINNNSVLNVHTGYSLQKVESGNSRQLRYQDNLYSASLSLILQLGSKA